MRNSTRLSLSWNTSVMSMESPKYRWRSAAHFGQKRSKCSAVSSPVPQWGQTGDVTCMVKAWYKAVDVSLLSLSWWIALCACRGTPGGILELSWPLTTQSSRRHKVHYKNSYHMYVSHCTGCWLQLTMLPPCCHGETRTLRKFYYFNKWQDNARLPNHV